MGRQVTAIGATKVDFCAVYATGPKDTKRPIRIGHAREPKANDILAICWVVDLRLAKRITKRCHRILHKAHKEMADGQFDIDAEWAKKVIAVAACEEGIPIYASSDVAKLTVDKEEFLTKSMFYDAGFAVR